MCESTCSACAVRRRALELVPEVIHLDQQRLGAGLLALGEPPMQHYELRRGDAVAISIWRKSDVDKAIVVIDNHEFLVDRASPLYWPITGSLAVKPYYGQNTVFAASLQLALWKHRPPDLQLMGREPKRAVDWTQVALSTTEATLATWATYRRSTTRVYFKADNTAVDHDVRLDGVRIRNTGVVYYSPIWPTAGDATVFETLGQNDELFTIDVEGWDGVRLRAKSSAGTPNLDYMAEVED